MLGSREAHTDRWTHKQAIKIMPPRSHTWGGRIKMVFKSSEELLLHTVYASDVWSLSHGVVFKACFKQSDKSHLISYLFDTLKQNVPVFLTLGGLFCLTHVSLQCKVWARRSTLALTVRPILQQDRKTFMTTTIKLLRNPARLAQCTSIAGYGDTSSGEHFPRAQHLSSEP